MKNSVKYEIIGFFVVSLMGVILHFVYEWTNENSIIGFFVPINESVFEHLKLIYFPYVIYGAFEAYKLRQDKFNIYTSKLIGVLLGMITIIAIYYIAKYGFGINQDWINIFSYFVGTFVAFAVSNHIIVHSFGRGFANGISLGMLIIIAIGFIFFTLFPIKIPLFQDPINLTFGIYKIK